VRTFLVIDGTNRVHVLWHVHKDVAAVVRHFARDLEVLEEQLRPTASGVAFDVPPSFRRQLCKDYKADRPSDDGVKSAIAAVRDLVRRSSAALLEAAGFEADDVLATVASRAVASGDRCVIASPDKDLRQCLVSGKVTILRSWAIRDAKLRPEWLTAETMLAEYSVSPANWIDFQCLVGDDTDGIKGAPGIGDVTARKWLAKATLAEILANRWVVSLTERQWRGLQQLKPRLQVVRQLVRLVPDVPGVAAWMRVGAVA
jgi:DNA polymerase-1